MGDFSVLTRDQNLKQQCAKILKTEGTGMNYTTGHSPCFQLKLNVGGYDLMYRINISGDLPWVSSSLCDALSSRWK